MNAPTPAYFYPNQMGRIILLAMEEIIGRTGVNAVLNLASLTEYIDNYPPHNPDLNIPFEHISRLQSALESAYGPRAGRGIALRAGRACFKYGLREFGPQLGLTDLAFRLLPLPSKLKVGSEAFAGMFNQVTHQRVRLEIDEQRITWIIECCPLCWGRQIEAPSAPNARGEAVQPGRECCHLAVGLLQEALYWASGGKIFQVEETECIASGGRTCTIIIKQTPLN